MNWIFNGESWWCYSQAKTGLQWRIVVTMGGEFSVSASDHGLTNREANFPTLSAAKCFCESSEAAALVFTGESVEKDCFVVDLFWVFEDRLSRLPRPPSEEEYKDLFASSRVVDGVRMFPAVQVDGVTYLVRSDAEKVLHQWVRSMSGDTLLCKCGAWKYECQT